MTEPERYPPSSSFQAPRQQQPRASSFHPGMRSWVEPLVAPSWNYVVSPDEAAASSSQQDQGGYEHRQSDGREWYQGGPPGGRMDFRPRRRGKKKSKWQKLKRTCDTCGRVFKTKEKYKEHVSQHVKCPVSDCNFTASEKLVSMHWKSIHGPGAKKYMLDTPEEICKWREERRKNYPTLQISEKKEKVVEAREQTGGVLEAPQFGCSSLEEAGT